MIISLFNYIKDILLMQLSIVRRCVGVLSYCLNRELTKNQCFKNCLATCRGLCNPSQIVNY